MRTFKLTIAYDGTDYCGWQIQPGKPTIQGMLERAIAKLVGVRIPIIGSGRTDSGVHAIAQVGSCTLPSWNADAASLATAMNTKLPDSIVVTDARDAPDDFHAIRDCVSKRYRYQIQNGGLRDPMHHRHWHRVRKPVNVDRIAEAAKHFLGTHDFASFQATGGKVKSTVRCVTACDVMTCDAGPWGQQRFAIEVESNGFLYNMVRNMVGSLFEVGRGSEDPAWITQVLAQRNRDAAGPTAPAGGLFLLRAHYRG